MNGENGIVIPLDGDHHLLRDAVEQSLLMTFTVYTNKYKRSITSFDNQAEELHGILLAQQRI